MRAPKRLIPAFAMAAVLLNVDAAFGCSTKAKVYLTAMKSDLRNLLSAQDLFFQENKRYAHNIGELGTGFRTSTGVATLTIGLSPTGYTARTTHSQMAGTCVVYVGTRESGLKPPNGTREGDVWCEGLAPPKYVQVREKLAPSLWVFLIAMTLATGLFLSRGPSNWPARGLIVLCVLYPGIVFSFCGTPSLGTMAALFLPGLGLFMFALRRKVLAA